MPKAQFRGGFPPGFLPGLLGLLLGLFALAGAAGAQTAGPSGYKDAAAELKAFDSARFAAMTKGDIVLLERMLAEDLTYIHATGAAETKAQFLDSLKSGKLRYVALNPDQVQTRGLGDGSGVVTGLLDVKVVADGKELAFAARYTAVYAKRHGRWYLVAWQSTRVVG